MVDCRNSSCRTSSYSPAADCQTVSLLAPIAAQRLSDYHKVADTGPEVAADKLEANHRNSLSNAKQGSNKTDTQQTNGNETSDKGCCGSNGSRSNSKKQQNPPPSSVSAVRTSVITSLPTVTESSGNTIDGKIVRSADESNAATKRVENVLYDSDPEATCV